MAGVRRLKISTELFLAWLRYPTPPGLRAYGIPSDVRIVGASYEPFPSGVVILDLWSETFSPEEKNTPLSVTFAASRFPISRR